MAIDAYEYREVENFDVPGEYLQTDQPKDKFTLLLTEVKFVDIMCDINPEYNQQVRFKYVRKKLYLQILKEIYGMIEYALLWYELYMSVIKETGLQINPYDMCVTNKDINGK